MSVSVCRNLLSSVSNPDITEILCTPGVKNLCQNIRNFLWLYAVMW
jgi:hypothetical protein